MGAAGVALVVGDERKLRQALQRERGAVEQRVAGGHDHAVRPAVAGQRDELVVLREGFGGDADVGLAVEQQLGDLLGRALVQIQGDLREQRAEVAHRGGQGIARLRVGGGNRQRAGIVLDEIAGGAAQAFGVAQHAFDDRQHLRAGLGQAGQAFAGAHEEIDAELVFQLADLAAHPRLRGVQGGGDFGQVEAAACRLTNGAQLLEVHG